MSKKDAIISYILEKIDDGTEGLADKTASVHGVNKSTIHRYLNELIEQGIVEKSGHGSYKLVRSEWSYSLLRSRRELSSDTYLFSNYLQPLIADFPANVAGIWDYALSEMTNNVIDHSGAEEAELSITQDALRTTVILQDNGIGIFRKIKEFFGYPSLEDAVSELFKGKLTTDEENHSGEGVFFTSRLMDSFYIVSSGKVFTCNRYDDSQILDFASGNKSGTRVIMSLSNHSNKEAKEIFDRYADIEGGFTRTSIPIKNIFDAPPVSRSQAKRICERLDRFKKVVLDFSDVEWIGQGFAHQIFVVYKNQHPDIVIEPQNMNEDVEKMYLHVS